MNLPPESKRCIRDGCDAPRHTRQLCQPHYTHQLRKYGPERPGLTLTPTGPSVLDPDGPVPDDTWRDDAACLGMDPDLFFPDHGNMSTADRAKAICAACQVREQCLDYALTTGQRWGIWGGTSERDRRRIRAERREQVNA